MEINKNILAGVAIGVLVLFVIFALYNAVISGNSVSVESCNSSDNDGCWHSLAHETLNDTYCNKIKDNETKEHCFEHTPK